MFVRRRGIPEHLGDIPGTVGIENQQAVALLQQLAMRAQHRLRRGTLQESARRRVDRRAQEVVRGRVADVQLDARIERGKVHQVGLPEAALLRGRLGRERFNAQFGHGPHRLDAEYSGPGLGRGGADQQYD
jgi:hypothetical protein